MGTTRVTSRRQFIGVALAAVALPAGHVRAGGRSPVGGIRLGVQTYSFREVARAGAPDAVDVILASMKACGLDECELWSPQIEATDTQIRRATPAATPGAGAVTPAERQQAREALRAWRLNNGPDFYEGVRRRFSAAGMSIYAYNLSFNESFTDEEITRGFEAARALGADVITASTTLRVAKRLVPFAEKHRIPVAMHNHSNVTDPNEFATPQSFAAALAMSPLFRINLDIGHFTAANFDVLAFLEQHHDTITNLHVKDRKKAQGDNVPWGTGDTPIRETLMWLKRRSSPVRAYVEYEYAGTRGPVAEVTACADFARKVLVA